VAGFLLELVAGFVGIRIGSRIASEDGRVEVVFLRDANQSEQRIPGGIGQRDGFRRSTSRHFSTSSLSAETGGVTTDRR
jgi:hypothetical protein